MERSITELTLQPMSILMIKKGIKKQNNIDQVDNVISEGIPINNISIIGLLIELTINSDQQLFSALIEDTTGNIMITYQFNLDFPYWLQKICEYNPLKPVNVKCIIQPKQLKQTVVFKCIYMEIIKNSNIITLHICDCINAYKYRKQLQQVNDNNSIPDEFKKKQIEYHQQEIIKTLSQNQKLSKEELQSQCNIPSQLIEECLEGLINDIQQNDDCKFQLVQDQNEF